MITPRKTEIRGAIECDPDHMPRFGAAILLAYIAILAKNYREFSQKLTIRPGWRDARA
jgi:hypothetical protein